MALLGHFVTRHLASKIPSHHFGKKLSPFVVCHIVRRQNELVFRSSAVSVFPKINKVWWQEKPSWDLMLFAPFKHPHLVLEKICLKILPRIIVPIKLIYPETLEIEQTFVVDVEQVNRHWEPVRDRKMKKAIREMTQVQLGVNGRPKDESLGTDAKLV